MKEIQEKIRQEGPARKGEQHDKNALSRCKKIIYKKKLSLFHPSTIDPYQDRSTELKKNLAQCRLVSSYRVQDHRDLIHARPGPFVLLRRDTP